MIWFNGFPFLDTKEEHTFHVPVSQVMTPASQIALLPTTGLGLRSLEHLLRTSTYQGFPIVEDRQSKVLVGYIGRTELQHAIDRIKKENPVSQNAKCFFLVKDNPISARTPSALAPAVTFDAIAAQTIDFSRFVNPTPLAVHPHLPLETVMELFKKMGPRVVLVEYKGRLAGLVTVKDCLKYQFKVEAQERGGGDGDLQTNERIEKWEAWLWANMRRIGLWYVDLIGRATKGRVKLGNGERRGESLLGGLGEGELDPRDEREPILADSPVRRRRESTILDGTEELDNSGEDGVELRAR